MCILDDLNNHKPHRKEVRVDGRGLDEWEAARSCGRHESNSWVSSPKATLRNVLPEKGAIGVEYRPLEQVRLSPSPVVSGFDQVADNDFASADTRRPLTTHPHSRQVVA